MSVAGTTVYTYKGAPIFLSKDPVYIHDSKIRNISKRIMPSLIEYGEIGGSISGKAMFDSGIGETIYFDLYNTFDYYER